MTLAYYWLTKSKARCGMAPDHGDVGSLKLDFDTINTASNLPATLPVTGGRALVPHVSNLPSPAAKTTNTDTPMAPIVSGLDVHDASPREIANISLDLYASGLLSYDDYTALAFQPELHPDYNRTIGALTGKPAAPDQPRDYVDYWNERLQFELRHNPRDAESVKQTARIHDVLKALGNPTRLTA